MEYRQERLGDVLVSIEAITPEQLVEALAAQARMGGKLGEVLVRELVLSEEELASALARQKGLQFLSLANYPIDRTAAAMVPERVARRRQMLPIAIEDGTIVLAMADPLDIESIDECEMRTGMKARVVVVPASQLAHAIDKYVASSDAFQDIVDSVSDLEEAEEAASGDDVPVVRLVNQLIREAVRDGASDIHIEPERDRVAVRYRVDGVMNEVMELPAAARPGVTSRVKIMAEMDISERRRPQDGRIGLRVDDRPVDIRVASLPTPQGETLTLRVLNSELVFRSLTDVGLNEKNLATVRDMLSRPYGALFVSGPTGSGKSTTLYGALQELNLRTRKLITVEDPIEYDMAGITQVAINPKIGLTFAGGLRTILRSDPDVVMVGEIRDPDTAQIAVQAALTGHLVLSSVHTNDAPSALTRLTDMGVPPYVTSSGLIGVCAQRLVRVLCPECKEQLTIIGSRLVAAGVGATESKKVKIFGPVGCNACGGSGYRGRTGIFEVMPMTDELTLAFLDHAPSERLREIALAAGMVPMRRDALDKVAAGITSLEEINRVVI
ncbi:MAG: type II secretion system protein GspE [Actinobacteria bacterium HGW-Actinobacteria-10]|nr:MAG: type II secretion system protein GspE [Actinobacteria bacterium HGW-Actinobacteria-10]